jgi:hypothetical protein
MMGDVYPVIIPEVFVNEARNPRERKFCKKCGEFGPAVFMKRVGYIEGSTLMPVGWLCLKCMTFLPG